MHTMFVLFQNYMQYTLYTIVFLTYVFYDGYININIFVLHNLIITFKLNDYFNELSSLLSLNKLTFILSSCFHHVVCEGEFDSDGDGCIYIYYSHRVG
jgi:hypothetical protein